jgi:DNA-binding CsgD family transcriptional regulator
MSDTSSNEKEEKATSITSRRQRTTDELLHWRRLQVIKLLSQGHTIDRTADILKLSAKTVQRDHAYIRAHSKQMMREYFTDTMPNEMLKVIARLTAVSDEAWELARLAK